MSTKTKLPKGWRVEMLGLINAVQFVHADRSLLWCDGQWTLTMRGVTRPVSLGYASTQKDARAVGEAFIVGCE